MSMMFSLSKFLNRFHFLLFPIKFYFKLKEISLLLEF